jgi:hypothetical protein
MAPKTNDRPLIPDAAVAAIQDSVKTEIIKIDGIEYATREVFDPPVADLPRALQLNTLSGLADYIGSGLDAHTRLAIHVVDHQQVNLVGPLVDRDNRRFVYATASADAVLGPAQFQFGRYYEVEEFVIKLATLFEGDDQLARVLQIVGNIKEERVRSTEDDGLSQTVVARAGVASVAEIRVPNPVRLKPYRTFREIEQPASPFLLRLRSGDGEEELPTCALYEADAGEWKLTAIERIAAFFNERSEAGLPPILA